MTQTMDVGASAAMDDRARRELEALHRIVARLRPDFPEQRPEDVERAVHRSYAAFQDSRVRDFIPILVERLARADLQLLRLPAAAH